MKKTIGPVVLAATLLIAASHAWASDPCEKDRITVCGDTTAGEGHVFDCLMGRQDKVTPACSSALDRATQLADAVRDACTQEVNRFCAQHLSQSRAMLIDCLKANRENISPECRSKYRQFKAFGFDLKS